VHAVRRRAGCSEQTTRPSAAEHLPAKRLRHRRQFAGRSVNALNRSEHQRCRKGGRIGGGVCGGLAVAGGRHTCFHSFTLLHSTCAYKGSRCCSSRSSRALSLPAHRKGTPVNTTCARTSHRQDGTVCTKDFWRHVGHPSKWIRNKVVTQNFTVFASASQAAQALLHPVHLASHQTEAAAVAVPPPATMPSSCRILHSASLEICNRPSRELPRTLSKPV